jgi:rhodanese-related sulfurtransferase
MDAAGVGCHLFVLPIRRAEEQALRISGFRPVITLLRAGAFGLLAWLLLVLSGCHPVVDALVGTVSSGPLTIAGVVESTSRPIVLDLRDAESYRRGHIHGAVNLSFEQLDGYLEAGGVAHERTVVVACYSGMWGSLAVPLIRAHGIATVHNLEGGMQAWQVAGLPTEEGPGVAPDPASLRRPVVAMTRWHQAVGVVSGLVVKPSYMVVSLVLILLLRGERPRYLVMLRHGLVAFLAGESFCALGYLVRANWTVCDPIDVLHGVGMILLSVWLPWALFLLLDDKVVRLVEPEQRCVLQRFCGRCWKREPVACGVHTLFEFLIPGLALMALLPLTAPLRPNLFQAEVFGSMVDYGMPVGNQVLEFRVYPITASALFLVALIQLRRGTTGIAAAQLPFFAGVGFMGFSLIRFVLFQSFTPRLVWSDFWEEVTELIVMGATASLVYAFRTPLGVAWSVRSKAKEG